MSFGVTAVPSALAPAPLPEAAGFVAVLLTELLLQRASSLMACFSLVFGLSLSRVHPPVLACRVRFFSYRFVDNTLPACTHTAVQYVVGASIGIDSTTAAAETGSLSRSVSMPLSARFYDTGKLKSNTRGEC